LVLNWRKSILGEIKFASALGPGACSDYIVKRRYVWKLPGVEDDRKIVGDVRAQIPGNHGWSSRPEMVEGLEVGRKPCPRGMIIVWVLARVPFWCSCWIGVA